MTFFFFLRAALIVCFLNGSLAIASPLKVLIDPGHGGQDQGATSGPIHEALITLQIAEELKKIVDKDPRFKVQLTREKDEFVSLPTRTALAEKNNFGLFLSIHANASQDPEAQGVEFYFQNQMAPDEESLFLASRENSDEKSPAVESSLIDSSGTLSANNDLQQILADLHRNYKIQKSSELSRVFLNEWPASELAGHSHTIRQAPFFVISQTTMPSVLIEVGFISNPRDRLRLTQSSYQKQVAQNLYRALVKFKETIDKDQAHL